MRSPTVSVAPFTARIVSSEGLPAIRVRLKLINMESGQVIQRSREAPIVDASHVITIPSAPCGKYRVDVFSPMLSTTRGAQEIELARGEQWLTLAYPFDAPPIDRWDAEPPPTVIGTLSSPLPRGRPCWAKIVGVYTAFVKETECDEQGRFMFRDLSEGIYVVIVTGPHSQPLTRVARVDRGLNRIDF